MPRPDRLQGSLDLLVMKILSRRGPLHGYAITNHIEQISEDILRLEEGSLYPALHRMEEAGSIKAKWGMTEHKRRVRMYELTASGRKELEREETRWGAVTAAVARVLKLA